MARVVSGHRAGGPDIAGGIVSADWSERACRRGTRWSRLSRPGQQQRQRGGAHDQSKPVAAAVGQDHERIAAVDIDQRSGPLRRRSRGSEPAGGTSEPAGRRSTGRSRASVGALRSSRCRSRTSSGSCGVPGRRPDDSRGCSSCSSDAFARKLWSHEPSVRSFNMDTVIRIDRSDELPRNALIELLEQRSGRFPSWVDQARLRSSSRPGVPSVLSPHP